MMVVVTVIGDHGHIHIMTVDKVLACSFPSLSGTVW